MLCIKLSMAVTNNITIIYGSFQGGSKSVGGGGGGGGGIPWFPPLNKTLYMYHFQYIAHYAQTIC